VTIINGMILTAFFLPAFVVGREEGVCLCRGVVYFRETETVSNLHGLTIYAGTADDVDVLVGGAMFQSLFEGRIDIAAGEVTSSIPSCRRGIEGTTA
jgi:hypothetical protein